MNSLTVITETEVLSDLRQEIKTMPVAANKKALLNFALTLLEEWMIFENGTPLHQAFCESLQLTPMPDAEQQLRQILDKHHRDKFSLSPDDLSITSN